MRHPQVAKFGFKGGAALARTPQGLDMGHPQGAQLARRMRGVGPPDHQREFLHGRDHRAAPSTFFLAILPRTTWAVCWSPR